jgi:hypothetical protein
MSKKKCDHYWADKELANGTTVKWCMLCGATK